MGREPKTRGDDDPLNTPVMRQYLELKRNLPDAILFFRMGDFYELFLEDAEIAAPIMDVALTRRQASIPMCGVPYHSADTYISRLLNSGRRVAIAEQSPDPDNPRLMRRKLQRIITAGTLVEENLITGEANNYLLAIALHHGVLGAAVADVSTGEFQSMERSLSLTANEDRDNTIDEAARDAAVAAAVRDWICRFSPREVLLPSDRIVDLVRAVPELDSLLTAMEPWKASPAEGLRQLEHRFGVNRRGLGFDAEDSPAAGAAALILHYVKTHCPGQNASLQAPVLRRAEQERLILDEQTVRHLELIQNQQDGRSARTLYSCLDRCVTAAGKRALRNALLQPFADSDAIAERQGRVASLVELDALRESVHSALDGVQDLERALTRQAAGRGAPRDFGLAVAAVRSAQAIAACSAETGAPWIAVAPALLSLCTDLETSIVESPPAALGGGDFIRPGVDAELDRAREARTRGGEWTVQFEARERERTGISSLRVKYNRIYGYFIEISRGQAREAPADYVRKQTLTGYERFSSAELSEMESELLSADETIARLEQNHFDRLSARLLDCAPSLKELMQVIGEVDLCLSLAQTALRYRWTRPEFLDQSEAILEIDEGRHPVVERHLAAGEVFTPNSVRLRGSEASFAILTGPNMAGKSTYIRQVALIQLLAQVGSFVPAEACRLTIADRIFTRIGAGDNLTRGESTFFVEMVEAARILNQCSDRSLVIMDEVGRGTSTYDGMSLAWAIVERLSESEGARPLTLFATHYHELTALAEREHVINLTMEVQERAGRVLFLHRVREGAADRSYGIHVARLAGIPEAVSRRAEEKLKELEQQLDRSRIAEADAEKLSRRRRSRRSSAEEAQEGAMQESLF